MLVVEEVLLHQDILMELVEMAVVVLEFQVAHQMQELLEQVAVVAATGTDQQTVVVLAVAVSLFSKPGPQHVMEFKHSHHQDHLPYHQV
jgi:hypothetical protein